MIIRWPIAFLCAALPAAGIARAQESTTAFVNVSVIPMDSERVLSGQTVLVQGNRISAMGPADQVQVPAAAVRVDGQGKFLIPGLGDMHVHLFPPPESSYDSSTVADLLFVLVANGVTTVRDMHSEGRESRQLALRKQVAAGELLGPRIYTAGDPDWSSPEAAAKTVAELKAAGHDFVKLYGWPRPTFDSVVAAAARVNLPVVGHVPVDVGVEGALNAHWASIEHMYEYLEYVMDLSGRWSPSEGGLFFFQSLPLADTAVWMKPDYKLDSAKLHQIAAATQRAGVWNCPTLYILDAIQLQLTEAAARAQDPANQDPADSAGPFAPAQALARARVLRRWLDLNLEAIKALHDAGAGLLLGTDMIVGIGNFGPAPGFSIHGELATLVRTGGLTPYQALETGTRNVAAFLGTLDSTGTVAVGKRADLVLLYNNPLQDIRHVAGPAGVMVGGKWLSRAEIDARLNALPAGSDPATAEDPADHFYGTLTAARQRFWPR